MKPEPSRLLPGREPVPKARFEGTHRLVPPEVTVERALGHAARMGITRVADVTGLDRIGVPVTMVTRPNARSLAVNQGKGLTLAAARASGVMEAVETHHAEHPRLPLRLASERELRRSAQVVDCSLLPAAPEGHHSPELPTLWAPGVDLLSGEEVFVPYEMVHTHYTTEALPGQGCFLASSNGLASGNHPLEALCHALYEVIERDATVLWELADDPAREATRIDLDTVTDPGCREVLDRFTAAGVIAAVWEQTSDLGVPVYLCEIVDAADQTVEPIPAAAGMGAHHDPGLALSRALTEAAQSRLTTIAGSRDDQPREAYGTAQDTAVLAAHRAELADTATARRAHRGVSVAVHETFDEDLRDLLARLGDAGVERVAAVDLAVPEIGVDVVRVVVPGLEHLAFGAEEFVPGPRARKAVGL
ncbi:YcaO-like family protein [Nocardiopsis exhalans]|uniref:YcaO-like family protein n=1 Tax=Nocardiopsis exhalans TaxID=163604 RepID=A0ABY5CZI0_9ACTN|nr:YcaO-like family protein [Nocardiopsis exhalans]USY17239.1 YcaO-like family protein [Nocardiopsis exhalans]